MRFFCFSLCEKNETFCTLVRFCRPQKVGKKSAAILSKRLSHTFSVPATPFLLSYKKKMIAPPFFALELSPFQEGNRKKSCLSEAGFLFYCDAKYVHADF